MSDGKSNTTIDVSPERLRNSADNLSPSGSYWVCDVFKAAADEIERLRRIEVAARVQADCYGAYPGLHAALVKDHNDE